MILLSSVVTAMKVSRQELFSMFTLSKNMRIRYLGACVNDVTHTEKKSFVENCAKPVEGSENRDICVLSFKDRVQYFSSLYYCNSMGPTNQIIYIGISTDVHPFHKVLYKLHLQVKYFTRYVVFSSSSLHHGMANDHG